MVGYFIEYSKSKVGYHVMPTAYFQALNEATGRATDFDWLQGQHHIDYTTNALHPRKIVIGV